MNRTIQPEIENLETFQIPRPIRTELPNGIPLTVLNAGTQEVVRIDILFAAGQWHQTQKLQALFTNRMLREGTRKFSAPVIAEKLDYYGAWLELSSSAEYAYISLYSLSKYVAETLDIVQSIIKEPLFPEKELNTILDSKKQQHLVNKTRVDFLAQRALQKTVYGASHPCGTYVEETDFEAITPDVLRAFYTEHYQANNCAIFAAGKVTDFVIDQITRAFGEPFGLLKTRTEKRSFSFQTAPEKRFFTEREDAMQSALRMGCATITRSHPDYLKFRVLNTIFGGYFGSRLMSNIREEKGYTYGISSGIMFYPDNGLFLINTEADNDFVEPIIQEVYREIDKLQQDLVSDKELTLVRNYMLGEMCRSYESPFSILDAWIFIHTTGLDSDYFTRSLDALKEVTAPEIRDLAERYLCKESLKEVIAGKKMA